MKVTEVLIELMVEDVDASVNFYQEVLSFSLVADEFDQGKRYWALCDLNGFKISFKVAERLKKEVPFLRDKMIGGSTAICFKVDNLEGYYSQVKQQCEMLDHPHLTPCGARAFSMLDNSGYVITIEIFD